MKICFNPYSPGFSIYLTMEEWFEDVEYRFNPYSPGFSIYFDSDVAVWCDDVQLQSLFTWIFYLFK